MMKTKKNPARKTTAKELQKLIDHFADHHKIYWWVSLMSEKGKAEAILINKRQGAPKEKEETLKEIFDFAKKKRLPVVAVFNRTIGTSADFKRWGFKKDPDRWGKMWVKYPSSKKPPKKNPMKKIPATPANKRRLGIGIINQEIKMNDDKNKKLKKLKARLEKLPKTKWTKKDEQAYNLIRETARYDVDLSLHVGPTKKKSGEWQTEYWED